MRVIALVAVPPALGSFIVDSTSPAVAPATGVRIAVGAGLKPTDGWTVLTSQHWVDALPPGKALSNSGGEGALEIPLLIGAPLLLCLALIGSATFIAVHARGDDLNKLVKIGISRLVVRRIVAVATAAAILPAALASASVTNPASTLRRSPSPSAASPTSSPQVMPANCTSDSRKPACSSVTPRASRSTGSAGGSLPTCSAAVTPARMTSRSGVSREERRG